MLKFRDRNLRELGEAVVGDNEWFPYRSSSFITEFFQDCGLPFAHDGSTRKYWAADRLKELLQDPQPRANALPERFVTVLRELMAKDDAVEDDPERTHALATLNQPLRREGFEAFYGEDGTLHIRHIGTSTVSSVTSPHQPFSPDDQRRRNKLADYLESCSEDQLIEDVLLPLFRNLGYQRVTPAGHKDKALEYGKDIWMRYVLPTQHVLYFGLQAKKGKLDAAGKSKQGNSNISEVYNQLLMMIGHEVFDPEFSRKVLVDHAIIVAGGEITKQAKNWIGERLDKTKRSQVQFMDRDDILNLFAVSTLPLPKSATHHPAEDDLPF